MSVLKTLAWLAVLYCVVVGCLFLLQRRLVFLPSSTIPDKVEAGVPEMRDITLQTEDGLSLRSWYHPASGEPTIVYFQGNAASIAERGFKARLWIDQGYGTLMVGYRGYGGNPGSPTETGLIADGRAAVEFLNGEGIQAGEIVLYGESLGSGVAVALAAETDERFAAVILEAPFTSVADIASARYWFVPVRPLLKDHFDSMARLDTVRSPLLVLHGTLDRIIPVAYGQRLFAAAPEPKQLRIFERGHHSDLFDHGAGTVIHDFLRGVIGK